MAKGIFKHKKGWHHTEITKRKMSKSMKEFYKIHIPSCTGKRASIETRKKLSMLMMGNKRCLGRKISAKTRRKMSLSQKKIYRYSGKRASHWKGGRMINDGYVYIYQPSHPFRSRDNYIFEHRLIMEKMLGRFLKPGYIFSVEVKKPKN